MAVETTLDPRVWERWRHDAGVASPYYDWAWAAIWKDEAERQGGGEVVGLRWSGGGDVVLYLVIRRPLEELPCGAGLTDLTTPYDFGGPLAVSDEPERALRQFEVELSGLCERWRVVSEFARLHPFRIADRPAGAVLHADNFFVDLAAGYPAARSAYRSAFRRNLRRAEEAGGEVEIVAEPADGEIELFAALYRATMKRVGAGASYLFSPATLERLLRHPATGLATARFAGVPAAALVYLVDGEDLFYFLGASEESALERRPNNLLFDRLIAAGAEGGARRLHLGGGSAGLRRFKAQMTRRTVPYYVLRRVRRPGDYRALCRAAGVALPDDPDAPAGGHFPAYRLQDG